MVNNRRLVCGVGINDADYVVAIHEDLEKVNGKRKKRLVWECPYYRAWSSMLKRCYSSNFHKNNPAYKGCSVSEEWHLFSNFRAWMEEQDWRNKQLDKDLLVAGNKIYSPGTCVFIKRSVNVFLTDSRAARGEWPIGVSFYEPNQKYRAQCRNPFTNKVEHLGYFLRPEEAHQSWRLRKYELAKKLASLQTDDRVAEALISRYKV